MKRYMQAITAVSILLTVAAAFGYRETREGWLLSLAVTFGTVSYHFLMRFAVGTAVDLVFRNRFDPLHPWFRPRAWEEGVFRFLRVEKWKGKVPTYNPDLFSHKRHTWREIASAGCGAELVHELIALFSFFPLIAIVWFGTPWVFVLTSLAAALYDLRFVVLVRYNRPRLLRAATREERKRQGT